MYKFSHNVLFGVDIGHLMCEGWNYTRGWREKVVGSKIKTLQKIRWMNFGGGAGDKYSLKHRT